MDAITRKKHRPKALTENECLKMSLDCVLKLVRQFEATKFFIELTRDILCHFSIFRCAKMFLSFLHML